MGWEIVMRQRRLRTGIVGALTAGLMSVGVLAAPAAYAAPVPVLSDGDTVYVGQEDYFTGSAFTFPIYAQTPADLDNPGDPDYWAYCLEQNISARDETTGTVGSTSSFLGSNYFATDSTIPAKVLWVLAHGYPALNLSDFASEIGVSAITRMEAVNAMQTAVWQLTMLDYDATFYWETPTAEAAFHYLVDGANTSGGMTPTEVTVSITAPAEAQTGSSLVGPFVVHTNQASATVSTSPALGLTDSSGNAIDPAVVVDGQEIYLDLRNTDAAGSATVTASVKGSNGTGKIISVPTIDGAVATAGDHAQSLIIVAADTAETAAQAAAEWAGSAPSIGTTLTDESDGDKVLAWTGGTVVDAVDYTNLTPGTKYTLTGELMRKSDGTSTGITGSVTFTPAAANGSVNVTFTVPTGYAGQSLVAFERLFDDDATTPVAVHEDINDVNQTVSVDKNPAAITSTTPAALASTGTTPLLPLGLAAILMMMGAVAALTTRRLSN